MVSPLVLLLSLVILTKRLDRLGLHTSDCQGFHTTSSFIQQFFTEIPTTSGALPDLPAVAAKKETVGVEKKQH